MTEKENPLLEAELVELARHWEETKYESAQATHVFAHPAAREFGKRTEAIPFMLERLKADITWVRPLEDAISLSGGDIGCVDHSLVAPPTGNVLHDKLNHLEGERVAILRWAQKEGLLSI